MTRTLFVLLLIGGVILMTGCAGEPDPPTTTAGPPFDDELLQSAAQYKDWGRVDDFARWAPYFCAEPPVSRARYSGSGDDDTHGRKLYSLYASDAHAYVNAVQAGPAPVGLVVIKESWEPEEVKDPQNGPAKHAEAIASGNRPAGLASNRGEFYPYAWKNGKVYQAGRQTALFIMMKFDPATPDTDQGWVYGTVSADGKTVTSVGKIESCMKCHQDAKHDRLFGLPAN